MKKTNVVLMAVFAMGLIAQVVGLAQSSNKAKDDLFAGTEVFEKNAVDVTEITMDPDSLAMVSGKDKEKAHNTVLQTVRTYEYDKPGMYNIADVDKIRERLNTGDWHCSVHERHLKSGEATDICEKRRADDLHESAIIEVEPKELTFIHTISHNASMMMPGMGALGYGMGVGYGMGLSGLRSLSSLSALNPEMLELRMNLNSLKYGLGMHLPMALDMGALQTLDSDEIEKAIDKAQKDWGKSGDSMKGYFSKDGKGYYFSTPEAPEAPVAPIAPKAPPAPAAPRAPAIPAAPPAPEVPETAPTPKAIIAPTPMTVPAPLMQ